MDIMTLCYETHNCNECEVNIDVMTAAVEEPDVLFTQTTIGQKKTNIIIINNSEK